jgi:hypothetical protein
MALWVGANALAVLCAVCVAHWGRADCLALWAFFMLTSNGWANNCALGRIAMALATPNVESTTLSLTLWRCTDWITNLITLTVATAPHAFGVATLRHHFCIFADLAHLLSVMREEI